MEAVAADASGSWSLLAAAQDVQGAITGQKTSAASAEGPIPPWNTAIALHFIALKAKIQWSMLMQGVIPAKSKERNQSAGLCLAELRNKSYATIKLLLQMCLLQVNLISGCNQGKYLKF